MPSFDIIKESELLKTYRVSSVISAFDLDTNKLKEEFKGNIEIEDKKWNIGVIVGSSGSGKTTIAKEIVGKYLYNEFEYKEKSVIDDMPQNKSVKEITKSFTSVGFASPPSWLKPYYVLSNGEKMRVNLARGILSDLDIFAFDEFTSVVNREVAKTGSYAISKAVKKQDKKFIAITVHDDIIEWLEPDWIYNTDEQRFFFVQENIRDLKLKLKSMKLATKVKNEFGTYLGNITI